jgi:hypothetical protein
MQCQGGSCQSSTDNAYTRKKMVTGNVCLLQKVYPLFASRTDVSTIIDTWQIRVELYCIPYQLKAKKPEDTGLHFCPVDLIRFPCPVNGRARTAFAGKVETPYFVLICAVIFGVRHKKSPIRELLTQVYRDFCNQAMRFCEHSPIRKIVQAASLAILSAFNASQLAIFLSAHGVQRPCEIASVRSGTPFVCIACNPRNGPLRTTPHSQHCERSSLGPGWDKEAKQRSQYTILSPLLRTNNVPKRGSFPHIQRSMGDNPSTFHSLLKRNVELLETLEFPENYSFIVYRMSMGPPRSPIYTIFHLTPPPCITPWSLPQLFFVQGCVYYYSISIYR